MAKHLLPLGAAASEKATQVATASARIEFELIKQQSRAKGPVQGIKSCGSYVSGADRAPAQRTQQTEESGLAARGGADYPQ
jgi:hypothetical protein